MKNYFLALLAVAGIAHGETYVNGLPLSSQTSFALTNIISYSNNTTLTASSTNVYSPTIILTPTNITAASLGAITNVVGTSGIIATQTVGTAYLSFNPTLALNGQVNYWQSTTQLVVNAFTIGSTTNVLQTWYVSTTNEFTFTAWAGGGAGGNSIAGGSSGWMYGIVKGLPIGTPINFAVGQGGMYNTNVVARPGGGVVANGSTMGGGGGASFAILGTDLDYSTTNKLTNFLWIVGGGGGGEGNSGTGGSGGGTTGANGSGSAPAVGRGGSQTNFGANGNGSTNSAGFLQGANGNFTSPYSPAGGAGFYGGGAGATNVNPYGGAGGASAWFNTNYVRVKTLQGNQTSDPAWQSSYGAAGTSAGNASAGIIIMDLTP